MKSDLPMVSWRLRGVDQDLATRGMVMGILNVTPDSFSDGGRFLDHAKAVEHGLAMVAEGADIIDVGGESTRPGAAPVALAEELERVIPVIEHLRRETPAYISVDTMKPEVARLAMAAGADIINDVSGFRDQEMILVAAETGAAVVVMHMLGEPRTMQQDPVYEDVVLAVQEYFADRMRALLAAGVAEECVAIDPGFGFGKNVEHNLTLLRSLPKLRVGSRPIVAGVSRKSMIGKLLGDPKMESRFWPTVALTAWMREMGAEVMRVHDVKPNYEALRMVEAIRG